VNRFITHFGTERCYVCEITGEIVAMAFALPSSISNKIQKFKNSNLKSQPQNLTSLRYVYACATRPQYRRQGVMAKLLETIYNEACRENIGGIFLHAADQNLENYYRRLGFENFFFRDSATFFKQREREGYKKHTDMQFITPDVYSKKRLQKLENYYFIDWNESFFYFLHETGMQFCEYKNDIFSLSIENETIIIDELLGDTPKEEIASLIFKHFTDFKTVEISYPGQKNCYGQIKWCKPQNENLCKGYFTFAME